ncbi:TetR/AcrR family transcriptional regulator [Williamsia phyllosphaerae]|uniref:TetR family transcriptional regulator n=1 Tax=Williamsia phyllosphaerae TaxID=885042 RepID=A0ABQ1V5G6_9NOCA|nr:TetR/AcrR family transcriptional regulator [Williamsia phyllosphaerae]GGF36596.1 TetR family transcriptional regulator [Williamsia phyllosphaerae]
MTSPPTSHKRGKAVRDGVLAAAVNELLNTGFDGVTIASVAESAGVHVTSVYRRWKTKEQLITDALLNHIDPAVEVPDTGDLRRDLVELTSNLHESLSSPQSKAMLRLASMPLEIDRLEEARRRVLDARMDAMGVVLDRAAERGEIDAAVDRRLALEFLHAPIYTRVLLTRDQVDEAYIGGLVDLLLDGVRAR